MKQQSVHNVCGKNVRGIHDQPELERTKGMKKEWFRQWYNKSLQLVDRNIIVREER
jgi:hypothetical protein